MFESSMLQCVCAAFNYRSDSIQSKAIPDKVGTPSRVYCRLFTCVVVVFNLFSVGFAIYNKYLVEDV